MFVVWYQNCLISPDIAGLALVIILLTGIIFRIFPTRRATKLAVIDALRYKQGKGNIWYIENLLFRMINKKSLSLQQANFSLENQIK